MRKRFLKVLFCCFWALSFFTGCGIEEFIYLYPVEQVVVPSDDPANRKFEFKTTDTDNDDHVPAGYFKGFEIYYRIYNTKTVLLNDISDISSYNTNYPTTVNNYLVTTKKYQRLNAVGHTGTLLIPRTGTNRTVIIRLVALDALNPVDMTIDGVSSGQPLRTRDGISDSSQMSTYDFDFDIEDLGSDDTDITYSTTWEDPLNKNWYVQAFVFAYGTDESYKSIYSEATSLGYVTIPE